jgi:hypothetical protein
MKANITAVYGPTAESFAYGKYPTSNCINANESEHYGNP